MSLQQSTNKRKDRDDKFKANDKFGDMNDWETEFGYINPLVDCRSVYIIVKSIKTSFLLVLLFVAESQ